MFVLAIHSEKQHLQAMLAAKGVVVRLVNGQWELASPPADGLKGTWIELAPHAGSYRVRSSNDLNLNLQQDSSWFQQNESISFEAVHSWFEIAKLPSVESTSLVIESCSELSMPIWDESIECLLQWSRTQEEDLDLVSKLIVDTLECESAGFARLDVTNRSWQVIAAAYSEKASGLTFDTRPLDALLSKPSSHVCLPESQEMIFVPFFNKQDKLLGAVLCQLGKGTIENQRQGEIASQLAQLASFISQRENQRNKQAAWRNRRRLVIESIEESCEHRQPFVANGKEREKHGTALVLWMPLQKNSHKHLEQLMKIATEVIDERQGRVVQYQSGILTAIWRADFEPEHAQLSCVAAMDFIGRSSSIPHNVSLGMSSGRIKEQSFLGNDNYSGKAIRLAERSAQLASDLRMPLLVADSSEVCNLSLFEQRPVCRAHLLPNEVATTLLQIGYPGIQLKEIDWTTANCNSFKLSLLPGQTDLSTAVA